MHGNWITICHAAHLIGDQTIIINNIQHAIPHLLKRHPRMRTRLHIDGYQHLLQILDYDEEQFNANLFYSIVNTTDQSWQKIVENECNRNPYSNHEKSVFPLFHFMLILNENSSLLDDSLFHILLFSNHCASDGQSGYILMDDFLTLVTSSDLCDRIELVNTEVIPCITQLTPRPYGIFYPLIRLIAQYFYKRELRKLNYSRIPVKTTFLAHEPTPFRFQPVKIKFLFTSSSSAIYSRLHEKCRAQQITLHGPLLGCLLLAIDHCFPFKNKDQRYLDPFNIDLNFSMRSRLPQSLLTRKTVGLYISICGVKLKRRFPLLSTSFWTLAKECMIATQKVITNGEINLTQHLRYDFVKDEQIFNTLLDECHDGRLSEINFSNVGKYPFSCDYNTGQLKLKGLHIVNNCSVYHSSIIVFVTCAGDDQLDFSLAHEIDSEEKAQEFLDYYVHLVEACADTQIGTTLHQLLATVKSE